MLRDNTLNDKSEILDMINSYFVSEKIATDDKSSLLNSLLEISITSRQRWWQDRLEQWRGLIALKSI